MTSRVSAPGKMVRRRRLARAALIALLAGSFVVQAPITCGAGTETPTTTTGIYRAWLDLQRQIARSEGRISDLEKQLREADRTGRLEGAASADGGVRPGAQEQRVEWHGEIIAERQRLSRLRDELERLGSLLP
jgi:hypothetical protein